MTDVWTLVTIYQMYFDLQVRTFLNTKVSNCGRSIQTTLSRLAAPFVTNSKVEMVDVAVKWPDF